MAYNRTKQAAKKLADANRWRGIPDRLCQRDADKLEGEAAEMLAPDISGEISLGEAIPPVVPNCAARTLSIRDTLQDPDQVARDASAERTDLLLQDSVDVTALAIDAANSINAENSLEKMLAHQLAAAHKAAFEIMNKGLQLAERIDARTNAKAVQVFSTESARLMNSSARMLQAFQQGMATLQKIRAGGGQTMTVQRIHVSDGGQALIGNVEGTSGEREKNEQ